VNTDTALPTKIGLSKEA